MTTDLHALIREALAANEVDAGNLTHQTLRAAHRHRKSHRRVAVAAAVLVVVLGATLLGTALSRRHENTGSNSRALDGVAGYRWRVTAISDKQGSAAVSPSWGASVAFSRDGIVFGDDTVNQMSGRYRVAKGGYTVTNIARTLVGSAGLDPIRARTVTAVDTLFGQHGDISSGTSPAHVTVELHKGALKLRRNGLSVTAARSSTQPDVDRSTPKPAAERFAYLGPLTRTTVTAGTSLLLRPPGATAAHVTPAQALHGLCIQNSTPSPCTTAVEKPDITLALLTTPNTGHVRADGTIRPSVDNVLSYVISWHHIACPVTGGPAPRGSLQASKPAQTWCTFTDAVDATTGKPNAGEYYFS